MAKPWIVGIDIETTGLELKSQLLLEVAIIAVDENLAEIESHSIIIRQDRAVALGLMGDYVTDMHTKSGLINLLGTGSEIAHAEEELMEFVASHFGDRRPHVFGNNVGFDRGFLERDMPRFNEQSLQYRNIDVSTLKVLANAWYPNALEHAPEKSLTHRALDDIRDSLAELRHYRDAGFITSNMF